MLSELSILLTLVSNWAALSNGLLFGQIAWIAAERINSGSLSGGGLKTESADRYFQAPSVMNECNTSLENDCYKKINIDLLKTTERIDTLKCLKDLLDLSRDCNHGNLESFYLKLISTFLNPRNEMLFMSSLKTYLLKSGLSITVVKA